MVIDTRDDPGVGSPVSAYYLSGPCVEDEGW